MRTRLTHLGPALRAQRLAHLSELLGHAPKLRRTSDAAPSCGRQDVGKDSAGWDRRYAGSELVWTSEANRFLAAEAEGLAVGRALDLACGEGRNAVWLAQRGWQVTGVDFSQVGLDKAARLAEQRGVWVQ